MLPTTALRIVKRRLGPGHSIEWRPYCKGLDPEEAMPCVILKPQDDHGGRLVADGMTWEEALANIPKRGRRRASAIYRIHA